jgi:hypothetical protein
MAEAPVRVVFLSLIGVLITLVPALLVPSATFMVALLVPAMFFLGLPIGTAYAAVQLIFPAAVRGTVSATVLLVLNLLGITLGNLLPGLLDDQLFHSDNALGFSMAITTAGAALAGALAAWLTFGPYRRDAAAQVREDLPDATPAKI